MTYSTEFQKVRKNRTGLKEEQKKKAKENIQESEKHLSALFSIIVSIKLEYLFPATGKEVGSRQELG